MEFKDKVLKIVSEIPRGKVLTYKDVAKQAGNPRAYRAVGNIMNKNRNPLVFCHRVVRSDGRVGGFFYGAPRKISILRKEGIKIAGQKIIKNEKK